MAQTVTYITPSNKTYISEGEFKWTEVEQKSFDEIKCTFAHNTLLAYPDFNKHFDIHTDTSDNQLGAVIIHEAKPIAFYSRKLTKT